MKQNNEIYVIQNPAIGAVIIWEFLCGYGSTLYNDKFELLFIIIPVILNQEFRNYIISTQKKSGFSKVIEKIMRDKKSDIVYQIENNINQMKELTLESIQIGMLTNLFCMDNELNVKSIKNKKPDISKDTSEILEASKKLGIWMSELTKNEIEKMLKVRF